MYLCQVIVNVSYVLNHKNWEGFLRHLRKDIVCTFERRGCFPNVWLPLKTGKNLFCLAPFNSKTPFGIPSNRPERGDFEHEDILKAVFFRENISTKPLMACPTLETFSCIYKRWAGIFCLASN